MARQNRRCAQATHIMRDCLRVFLQAGLRELFEIGAAFVMRQVWRMSLEARSFERLTESIECPAAAKRAVHKDDRCHDCAASHGECAPAAPIRQTITSKPPR